MNHGSVAKAIWVEMGRDVQTARMGAQCFGPRGRRPPLPFTYPATVRWTSPGGLL